MVANIDDFEFNRQFCDILLAKNFAEERSFKDSQIFMLVALFIFKAHSAKTLLDKPD